MRALVTILNPGVLGTPGSSYGETNFVKYGVCYWEYDGGWRGPVHWINWEKSCFEPEYPNPVSFNHWVYPNVLRHVDLVPVIVDRVPDIIINTLATNLLTGAGIIAFP